MAKQMIHRTAPQYEQRLILFIDFLGFKEIVEATASDSAELKRLIDALEEIGNLDDGAELPSQRVTQFQIRLSSLTRLKNNRVCSGCSTRLQRS